MADDSRNSTNGLEGRIRDLGGTVSDAAASDVDEPCASCGDETAPGSVRFSDRHDLALPGGGKTFLCEECYQRIRAAKGGEVTDADLRTIASNGLVIGVGFFRHG